MASATARPNVSFHLQTPLYSPRTPRINLILLPKTPLISTTQRLQFITTNSIDVSKQDKSISEEPDSSPIEPVSVSQDDDDNELSLEEKFDKRRLEERFAVLNTGIHECRSCGYLYNQSAGDTSYPIPPGLSFDQLPQDWRCPTCGAAQSFFQSKSVEIAGFAENQQFGLGANTLTSGQKLLLIYGSLAAFFALFLSGYFLQ
ncbi:hypothetical protein ACHQM5_026010 [Ranunculus cassubicifolius]